MTDDLISRAAALSLCDGYPYVEGVKMALQDLPAVAASQPDPREAVIARQAEALTAANAYITDLIRHEGQEGFSNSTYDLGVAYDKALAAIETQPDPRDAVIAQLVEAIGSAVKWTDQYRWSAPWTDDARAALAAAKGGAA